MTDNNTGSTQKENRKLTEYIESTGKKLASPQLLKNPNKLPTPLSIIQDVINLKQFNIDQSIKDDFISFLNKQYLATRKLVAKSLEEESDQLASFQCQLPDEMNNHLNKNGKKFLEFYNTFRTSLTDMVKSKAYTLRQKQTPIFLQFSISVHCLPSTDHSDNSLQVNAQTTVQMETTALKTGADIKSKLVSQSKEPSSRNPLGLTWDYISSFSAQLARNATSEDSSNTPPLISSEEKKLLENPMLEKHKEAMNKAIEKLNKTLENTEKRQKILKDLEKQINELKGDNWVTRAIGIAKHYIPSGLETTYNFCNKVSIYLNSGIITLMIINGFNQLLEGKYLDFIDSVSRDLFAMIPRFEALIPSPEIINNDQLRANHTQQIQETIADLNKTSDDLRNYGYHRAGTPKEFIKTPGSNSDGWVPVNAFTTAYVSVLGILSVMNGIITQYQTFSKLNESEQLSLVNGQLDVPEIEAILTKAAIPQNEGCCKSSLYTPSWGDRLKDAGSHFVQFNAHLKRSLRYTLSFALGNGILSRLPGNILTYLTGSEFVMSHFTQAVHARLHSYEASTEFSKDAQLDRMMYSFFKLAGFDTTKPFIDTRVTDTTNLIVGMAILGLDFPVATLAKSSLARSVQTQIQHTANHDALRDLWDHDGKSVNETSHKVLGKLYGNGKNSLKNSIQPGNVRPIEKCTTFGFDYDRSREYTLTGLGLLTKAAHGINFGYNAYTYILNPVKSVLSGTANITKNLLSKSLANQPGPHNEIDEDVHSINILRKDADNYFFGWLSPISIKFISTGIGKVLDNISLSLNVHASLATFNRRGKNHVTITETVVGSFKDAITGALNRLAIAWNNKPFQTFTGAGDQGDTPAKEAATSYAQHRSLTMLPPATVSFTESAVRKKVIRALRSESPLTTALEETCAPLASSIMNLGFQGTLSVAEVVKDSITPVLSEVKGELMPVKRDFSGLPNAIKKAKDKLANSTQGFMRPSSEQFHEASAQPAENSGGDNANSQGEINSSINKLKIYVIALSDLLESAKDEIVKRFEILQIYALMSQENKAHLEYQKVQAPLQNIRDEVLAF